MQGRVELVGGDHLGPVSAQVLGDVAGERAEPAELSDDDAQLTERPPDRAQALDLADRGHARAAARAGAVDLQGANRRRPAHPVDDETAVALELLQGGGGRRPEDAVDTPAVEAEAAEPGLQRADVVAADERRDEAQRSIAETPRRLDERQPGRLVTAAVVVQAARALEGPHGGIRGDVERTGLGAVRAEAGGTEPALEVAYGVAALTEGQLEETRNSSSSWSSWDLPLAPTRRLCNSPPLKTRRVGMLITS